MAPLSSLLGHTYSEYKNAGSPASLAEADALLLSLVSLFLIPINHLQDGPCLYVYSGTGCRCCASTVWPTPIPLHAADNLPSAQAGLNTAAKASGKKFFGSATDNPYLDDEPYVRKLSNTDNFGQITPGNSMKVRIVRPGSLCRMAKAMYSGARPSRLRALSPSTRAMRLWISPSRTDRCCDAITWFGTISCPIGV